MKPHYAPDNTGTALAIGSMNTDTSAKSSMPVYLLHRQHVPALSADFSRKAIQKCRKCSKNLHGEDLPYCTTVLLMRHDRHVSQKLQTKKERQAGFAETAAEDIQLPATGYHLWWKLIPLALSPPLFLHIICESWVNNSRCRVCRELASPGKCAQPGIQKKGGSNKSALQARYR
jgi:hypothetical protein